MAVLKLSQIAAAGSAPAASDVAVGVTGGTTDNLFSYTQVGTTVFNTVGLTIGSAKINSGTTNRLMYDNAGVVGEATVAGSLTLSGGILSVTAGGIASPSGSVQFNNSGQFGGDSGFTYAGTGQATLALGTITTNNIALNITGTWNASGTTFDAPLFMNITNTASNVASSFLDIQNSGTSIFQLKLAAAGLNRASIVVPAFSQISQGGNLYFSAGATRAILSGPASSNGGLSLGLANGLQFYYGNSDIPSATGITVQVWADPVGSVNGNLAIGNTTNATGLRVYNTTDQGNTTNLPTNYERGVFDWTTTANVLTIGTQNGGTGSVRGVNLIGGGLNANSFFNAALLIASGSGPLASGFFFVAGGNASSVPAQYPVNITQGLMRYDSALVVSWGNNFAVGSYDVSISRAAANVLQIGNTSGASANGWLNWLGEQRTASATNYTNATPTTIMSVALLAGRTYSFDGYIPVTAGGNAGGVQVVLLASGGLTATAIQADSVAFSNNVNVGQVSVSTITTLTSVVLGAATGYVEFHGTITVNVAGTLNFQTAQNTTNATTMTIGRGARVFLYDMP